ncbi:hypothetical protein H5410_056550 [Solanum commersonii]|uniref:Uncharacterized protein n=1 Tax=Solanum commersonii TaxID=4109 RepID=A0A9J5WN01_SOLCO|nr:hypothetical protein H5410_056550 [Solanum commersonii]
MSFLPKYFMDVRQDLRYGVVHESFSDPDSRCHFYQKNLWMSIKNFGIEPIALLGKTIHFQRQTNPGAGKLPVLPISCAIVNQTSERVNAQFCGFSCAIVHGSFGDPDFLCQFCQNNFRTFVKSLSKVSVGPNEKIDPFSRSNNPKTGKPPILLIFVCYSPWLFW